MCDNHVARLRVSDEKPYGLDDARFLVNIVKVAPGVLFRVGVVPRYANLRVFSHRHLLHFHK